VAAAEVAWLSSWVSRSRVSPSTSALVNTDGACSRASVSWSPSKAYSMALEAVMTARPRPPNCSPMPIPVPARAVMSRSNAPA
jgi:hypothetical protein